MTYRGRTCTAVIAILWATQSAAFCADITGQVSTPHHGPLKGAVITATAAGGGMVGHAATNAAGQYRISGLVPGVYDLFLKTPPGTCKSGSAVAYLGKENVKVDWACSRTAEPLALEMHGAVDPLTELATNSSSNGPFGLNAGELGIALAGGALVVGGIIVGVTQAPASHPTSPASPSL